jgi:Uma2 family endonuclease
MAERTWTRYKVSREEYEAKYAGRRYEYVDGYAVPMGPEIEQNGEVIVSPTKSQHGELSAEVGALMRNFVREHRLGKVFGAETGFVMDQQTGDIRAADVAFVAKARVDQLKPDDWIPFPPDLAVEIISEHERAGQIRDKALQYMENGTRLLWLFYPDNRVIDIYRPGQPTLTLRPGDTLDGGDVIPGFTASVADIFAILDDSG